MKLFNPFQSYQQKTSPTVKTYCVFQTRQLYHFGKHTVCFGSTVLTNARSNVALTYCFKHWWTQRKLASLTLKGSTLWLANSHVRQTKLNVLLSSISFHCKIINIRYSLTYRYADACAFSVCYVMRQNNHRSYTGVAAIYHEHYLCESSTFEDWWKHDHRHHILQVDQISVSVLPHELPVTNMVTNPFYITFVCFLVILNMLY